MLRALKTGTDSAKVSGAAPRWGGQPWAKLALLKPHYIERNAQQLTTLKYKRSPNLSDIGVAELVWESLLLADEESGANNSLGHAFPPACSNPFPAFASPNPCSCFPWLPGMCVPP